MNKIHISRKEEIDSIAYGNYHLIVVKLIKAHNEVMNQRNNEQGDKKPKLCSCVSYRAVQEQKLKEKVLIEKGGKIVSNPSPLNETGNKIKDDIYRKSDKQKF